MCYAQFCQEFPEILWSTCIPLSAMSPENIMRWRVSLIFGLLLVQSLLEVTMHCLVILYTDVLKEGGQQLLQAINDLELRNPAKSLPITVLHSRPTGSTRKCLHVGAFKCWKAWAVEHALPVFPTQAQHVPPCLKHLAKTLKLKSVTEEVVNAPGWVRNLAGVGHVTCSQPFHLHNSGRHAENAGLPSPEEPISSKMLAELVEDTNRHR